MSNRPVKKQKKLTEVRLIVEFEDEDGNIAGPQLDIPSEIKHGQLEVLLNKLLKNEQPVPYIFKISDMPLESTIGDHVSSNCLSVEQALKIVYRPQSLFRVRPITRCSASMPGHTEAILNVSFSPDGKQLASGSGDTTVRLWDINTTTSLLTCKGHNGWVLVVSWSPDSEQLCTGDVTGKVILWNLKTGEPLGVCRGHKKWITSIAWEPAHLKYPSNRLCTGSKDCSIKIWNSNTRKVLFSFSHQSKLITCVKWGGNGYIYSSSRDTSICVWDSDEGILVTKLMGHAHWVNSLALSSDYVLRTGPYDHQGNKPDSPEAAQQVALERYKNVVGDTEERLISGSDDHTLILWNPKESKKPIARLTGHLKLINQVQFSPDGKLVISAGFDNSIKVWDGVKGTCMATLSGHIGPVFQVSWSPDSRLLVSCSKDTMLKVWDIYKKNVQIELPGHEDEIFALDWAPNGAFVASGGRDKILKLWRH